MVCVGAGMLPPGGFDLAQVPRLARDEQGQRALSANIQLKREVLQNG
jgi:hypothetical protein